MTNQELKEYNKNRSIRQICLVTDRPINDVLKEWVEILHIGPWKVITFTNEVVDDPVMLGQPVAHPFKYYCAVTTIGDMQIEILKPEYGMTHLEKFLGEKEEGLQHFKIFVPDQEQDAVKFELHSRQIPITYSGHFFNDSFCNLGTSPYVGFDIEIGNCADVNLPDSIFYSYPPE